MDKKTPAISVQKIVLQHIGQGETISARIKIRALINRLRGRHLESVLRYQRLDKSYRNGIAILHKRNRSPHKGNKSKIIIG
jgi:hypothetical protein